MNIQTQKIQRSRLVNRSPVFYGWVVLAVGTLGLIATSPGQTFTVSRFFDHFVADFGLDRTTVSSLYGLGTFIASLSLIWVGRRIDRNGNRVVEVVVSGMFALVLAMCSLIASPVGLLFAFIAIRGLGQGSLVLVNSTAIAQWFRRRRGQAMSLALIGFALFQSVYVPWLTTLIESQGWRQAWIVLGIGVALTILPITWIFMRNRPEDFGLLPDGDPASQAPAHSNAPIEVDSEENWMLREALRLPIFWIFLIARMIPPTWGTGLTLHQISLFANLGHDTSVADLTFAQIAIISAVVLLFTGWAINRIRPGRFLAFQLAAMSATLILATFMRDPLMLILYALAFALVMGSGGIFDGTVWPDLFGRKHQGEIRGFVATTQVIGSALGPIIFGWSYDYLGGYDLALWLGVGLSAILAVSSLFVNKPRRHVANNSGQIAEG